MYTRDEMQRKLFVQFKLRNEEVEVKTERGSSQQRTLINEERNLYATVKLIEGGESDTEEFDSFVRATLFNEK